MTDNQFDKFFRDRLQGLPSQVPENMWSRIQQKKDKDRKFIFFWRGAFLGLLAALVLLGSGYYLWVKSGQHATAAGQPCSVADPNSPGGRSITPAVRPTVPAVRPTVPAVRPTAPVAGQQLKVADRQLPVAGQYTPTHAGQHSGKKMPTSIVVAADQQNIPPLVNKKSVTDNAKPPIPKSADHKLDSFKIAAPKPAPKKEKTPSPSGNSKWFLDIYGSPDLAVSRWRDNDSLAYIRNLLKTRLSYTVGARVSRSFGEHFSGKIGLQYSVINEWYMPDPNGSVFHKRIKTVDIPVLIGYAWDNDEFGIAVNTGMIFNAHTWYSSAPTDSIGDLYKSWLGMSVYLGVDVSRKLNDQIQLFAEPYFKYRLSEMMRPEIQIGQKIDIFGVLLGVRYNFKKSGHKP